MYNSYPQNKNNFSNTRNKTDLRRSKYEVCKTSNMHREGINNKEVTYRDNFLSEIGQNCGTYGTHKNWNNLSKIFKLFKITNVPTTTEEMVEYAYSTVDVDEVDEVVKNNFKISNETSVTNIQNVNKSSEKLLDDNISK